MKARMKNKLLVLMACLILVLGLSHVLFYIQPALLTPATVTKERYNLVNNAMEQTATQLKHNLNLEKLRLKQSFNLGELNRGMKMADKIGSAESLKQQNKCPDQYSFPDDIRRKFSEVKAISDYSLEGKNLNYSKTIVILTPLSNYAHNVFHYFKLLCSLSYPHHLITVVMGEDSSTDDTYHIASVHAKQLAPYFNNMSIHHFHHKMPSSEFSDKHAEIFQEKRRSHLAKARNRLLFEGLGKQDIVLWLDVDVKYVPKDIIQHLLSADKPVIVPSCMFKTGNGLDVYDKNTWQETNRSLAYLKKQPEDYLRLEGYTGSMRKYLPNIQNEGHVVRLDGVGGCILMVQADYHRQGLVFPTFIFKNHIETEGMAKMAAQMNIGVFGLPFLYVIHW